MSGTIISGVITDGVTLTVGGNPASVTSSADIAGPDGIYGGGPTNWTIDNQGAVTGTSTAGIHLANGGTIANQSAGTITGVANGVLIAGDRGTVTNAGAISEPGAGGAAVSFAKGGLAANSAVTASINGSYFGVYITGQAGTVTNVGTISSGRFPIYLKAGGMVSNAASGTIEGGYGVKLYAPGGIVTNLGTIIAAAPIGPAFGVYLLNGGTIVNGHGGPSSALIRSYYGLGIRSLAANSHYAGTVTNYGTILATGAASTAIGLTNGGTVVNGPSSATAALIQGGRWGVYGGLGAVVTNLGTIEATGAGAADAGVFVQAQSGNVSNLGSTALIDGYYGVVIAASGTLTNAGTIASTHPGGVAAQLSGGGRLVVEPGAVFVGNVIGSGITIELAGTTSGTIGGLGTYFTGFNTIAVDAGAKWTVVGNNAMSGGVAIGQGASLAITGSLTGAATFAMTGGTLELVNAVYPGTAFDFTDPAGTMRDRLTLDNASGSSFDNAITGFGKDDEIVLPNVSFAAGSVATVSGSALTVELAGNSGTFTFSNFNFQAGVEQVITVGTNSIVDPACFVSDTQISTARGQLRVDDIRLGDRIHVLVGSGSQPVIWIGHRTIDCARHPRPQSIWPVRITAGAFGPARPRRDLWLSPNHAVFIGGVLIPVKFLINGTSVAQVPVAEVSYYHLELPHHDVLLAEGLPAESYLDMGDRANYGDGGSLTLYPDFAERWDAGGCAPLTVTGPVLAAARRRIDALAGITAAAA